ncbi:YjiH family protein [Pseudalkalibacillus caeni]|uniref:YjiH family protein n=1 Tax=Exobacillus caeni TaxID=2574798 RepID=A0A5R9F3E8_9BACL|nr:YjiH family protein [Pseudalkalibacillus caeni]TLS36108.1 YjiH family protein [Pseudalkalibacillus caeni]
MQKNTYSTSDYLKFIIPSLIGMFLFMVPIQYNGETTIPVAILAGELQGILGSSIPYIVTGLITITVIGTLIAKVKEPRSPFFNALFNVGPLWMIARVLGMVFAVMTLFELGPEWVWSANTGGLLLYDLLPVLFAVFLFAGLFLPLLLDFGLLELTGALLTKIMRPLFTLPGRSSIDCLASWLGDGTIGVLLTTKQYEDGFYSKREAAVIGTTFSVVSITFTIVVLDFMKLGAYFGPYYLTIALAGFIAAIIMPRIPPLSRKENNYYGDVDKQLDESIPENMSAFSFGWRKAAEHAHSVKSFAGVARGGVKNVLDMWLGVVPIVMALGTLAVIIAETTPVFEWVGAPFVPLLSVMQVPEAAEAAQTMVVGFADMFLPAVIGSEIESELTRFVIACLSVTQLIYMSEVGGLLLGSKLPVNFKDLIVIFLLRTIITLPVIVIMAHIIF